MEQRFHQYLNRHALVPEGGTVLAAVSGGVDSVVLLHLLHRLSLSPHHPFTLKVAHLDHSLCPQSVDAAALVKDLCRQLQLPLVLETATVTPTGTGVEAAARVLRYRFLRRVAKEQQCDVIALAHHRDDQAETMLYRLSRGTGVSGLAAMAPHHKDLVRPLLFAPRDEIEAWACQHEIVWWEDPGNLKVAYDRNRLRHRVMSELRQINPQVSSVFSALADQVRLEEEFWQQQVDQLLPEVTLLEEDGLHLSVPKLCSVHPALQYRLLRVAIDQVRSGLMGIDRRHLQALIDLLASKGRPQSEVHLPGLWGGRRYDRLWLRSRPPKKATPFAEPLPLGGSVELPGGGSLEAWLSHERLGESRLSCECDPEYLSGPLQVRTWRAGDRIALPQMSGRTKLQDLFTDLKLTVEQRASQPVVVAGDEILWLPGLRRSRLARADMLEKPCLRLVWHP